MPVTTMPRATDVPKSGSSRMRPANPPTMSAIGGSAYLTSSMRCMRRSSVNAVKKMAATLASSDGWMPKPPTPNQRREPLIGREKSTATSIRATSPTTPQISCSLR